MNKIKVIKTVGRTAYMYSKGCIIMSTILHCHRELRPGRTGNTYLFTQTIF